MTNAFYPPGGGPILSDEQQAIVHSCSERLRVLAFAGTGKTTTLRAYASARPQLRMLYLAFNRTVAAEARGSFPANVTCSTIHSLAYRTVGYRYRHQLQGQLRATEVAVSLGLDPALEKDLALAHHALTALQHFLCSGAEDLAAFGAHERYPIEAMRAAERLWELMADPRAGQVPMLHDGYLKLYQLSDPRLKFDVILLDEAQDTNPVTLAILERQSCATVFVGDPHQQIYQFRHATNAMAMPGAWDELALTGSFRFGEEIAAAANRLLLVKGESRRVRGLRQRPPGNGTAFIARGNAALFQQAVDLAKLGKPLYWCGGIDGYRHELLLDLWHLRLGETSQIRDRFIAGFKCYNDLCVYSETQDVRDLKAWCHLLERLGSVQNIPEQIAGLRRCAVSQVGPGVVALATAHKAKGLEFAEVELADDFHDHDLLTDPPFDQEGKVYEPETTPMLWDDQGYRGAVLLPEEELNLRYVAVTRAEAVCRSKLWPAPLFADMAAYVEENPRFLLVASHTVLKPSRTAGESKPEEQGRTENTPEPGSKERLVAQEPVAAASQQPLHRLMRAVRHLTLVPDRRGSAGEVTRDHTVNSPTCPTPANEQVVRQAPDTSDSSDTQPQAVLSVVAPARSRVVWHLGALDASQVRVVVQHYRHRYPALDWGWLLNALAELRLVAEPQAALAGFTEQHQLGSAVPVLQRFLQDVGLWVVAE